MYINIIFFYLRLDAYHISWSGQITNSFDFSLVNPKLDRLIYSLDHHIQIILE